MKGKKQFFFFLEVSTMLVVLAGCLSGIDNSFHVWNFTVFSRELEPVLFCGLDRRQNWAVGSNAVKSLLPVATGE